MVKSIDAVRDEIVEICNKEYESSKDNESYFIAKGQTSYYVKQNILSKLKPEHAKLFYIDSLLYVLDVNGDTFINIT